MEQTTRSAKVHVRGDVGLQGGPVKSKPLYISYICIRYYA